MSAVYLLALAAPLGEQLYRHGWPLAANLMLAIVVTCTWQALFALLRKRSFNLDGLVTAVLFTIMVSPANAYSRTVLALSFGVVIGEQIFGGRGRNFVNPAVVALAFVFLSFPGAGREPVTIALLSLVPGAIVLIISGLISWRVLLSALLAWLLAKVAVLAASGVQIDADVLPRGLVVFGIVFFVCDAVCAASTNAGRWVYGSLAGALIVMLGFSPAAPVAADAVVHGALLASVFAPLIDQAAIALNVRRRRLRYG